jgi:Arc/MetJ-type ribon-helix-helix transcriptional regulator
MPSDRASTTIRFTDEDREILDKLQKILGFDSASAVIRFALREELGRRQGFTLTKKVYGAKAKR